MLRILLIGPQWHGSDAAGLVHAFRRLSHAVKEIDPDLFIPGGRSLAVRISRRLLLSSYHAEFNAEIAKYARILHPHFVVVYKGGNVLPTTLASLKGMNILLFLVYPDVSMFGQSELIPRCMPLYDWVFTTKSFGLADLKQHFGIDRAEFLPHGYDPDIHRPLPLDDEALGLFGCDASFIGNWSPKKEHLLANLAAKLPKIRFRVWGPNWTSVSEQPLRTCVEGTEILGDPYPIAIGASKVNIAILSEIRAGSSSGDLTTSRTFSISASGGFMLHERTDELLQFYREGREVACFADPDELVDKVVYYLAHNEEREAIRVAGMNRCRADNSQDARAARIIARYEALAREQFHKEGLGG